MSVVVNCVVVNLPALGESVTEGTVVRWLKAVGDEVAFEEPLLEVATDKVDTEIPSPVTGRLVEITAWEDETVPVGSQLALIEAAGGELPVTRAPRPQPQPASSVQHPGRYEPSAGADPAVAFVTPLVRRLASENGIDLAAIHGSGLGGRIRKQGVFAAVAARAQSSSIPAAKPEPVASAADAPAAEPARADLTRSAVPSGAEERRERISQRRRLIAAKMVDSLQTSAQLTSVVEVDVTSIHRKREAVKERFAAQHGIALSYLPFFAKAALEALRAHPLLNASLDLGAGEVVFHNREHLAIAVDTPRGLITPVIRDAGDLTVTGLARNIADLAERARANRIGADQLSGGTFTLTNTGSRGSLFDTPIINQPQVAVLGTGAVVKRVAVVDDAELGEAIAVRRRVFLALTYDHRLVDGADAARFLVDIGARLEAGAMQL
ncbi:2-oxo acid dehydrogenase subunit E2 [Mycolicibacterium sp. CBM1]